LVDQLINTRARARRSAGACRAEGRGGSEFREDMGAGAVERAEDAAVVLADASAPRRAEQGSEPEQGRAREPGWGRRGSPAPGCGNCGGWLGAPPLLKNC
jgi:hypothetical protein